MQWEFFSRTSGICNMVLFDGLIPILHRCQAIFFLKYILKISLAGEAEVTADLTQ